ncbi:hypothetical protein AvCA_16860 [Azotobacter vinelandii CA]|uniref:Uncharacterized protein n=2 Tax=Azotobacter vinelandii TaxID=354 RepID=C1DSE5_AZOVD|nr:hypothetical protein Avin_16860 [Azotobacter vinelandii DJ]AGK15229.1 hypothetical protein AvCA_16860 [Azotobacter vinelandii CA]AGK20064.1 hypothetical protein AvCA6_16860 [Azotobacter vinelandii CA6]
MLGFARKPRRSRQGPVFFHENGEVQE